MEPNIAELAARYNVSHDTAHAIFTEGHTAGRMAPRISGGYPAPKELAGRLTKTLYHTANERRMSLSALLEEMDPSDRYNEWVVDRTAPGGRRRMDAFERQLAVADIRTKPDLEAGIPAHPVERFWQSNSPASSILFPEFINRTIRAAQMDESILDLLVGVRTLIDGNRYTAFRLQWETSDLRMQRVAEGSEMRRVTIRGLQETIRLHKYGVEVDITYEAARRMSLDIFARHLQMIAQQNDLDKATQALDVLINGDGNANTAATETEITSVGGAGDGTITAGPFLKWATLFRGRYAMTTLLGQAENVVDLMLMNIGSGNMPFIQYQALANGAGSLRPRRPFLGDLTISIVDSAPTDKLVGLDPRYALEMVSEIGADLTETDKIINKQLNEVVISEVVGFAVMDPDATRVLDLEN